MGSNLDIQHMYEMSVWLVRHCVIDYIDKKNDYGDNLLRESKIYK